MIQVYAVKDGVIAALINEKEYVNVKFIRNFPIKSPIQAISVMNKNGEEIYWIDDLNTLKKESMALILESLEQSEHLIDLVSIEQISSNVFPCEWIVITKKERTHFTVDRSEHIIQMNAQSVLLKSSKSIYYLIRNIHDFDRESKKIIDPFILIE